MLPWKLPFMQEPIGYLRSARNSKLCCCPCRSDHEHHPAKATIEIHPVSFTFDEQTHGGSYLVYGIRDEIPEHEVSYSTDNEIFVADEPMAVGTYAMRIQITDPDYEK